MTAPVSLSDRGPEPDPALRDAVQDAVDAWLPIGVYLPGSDSARIAEHALAAAGRVLAAKITEQAAAVGSVNTGDASFDDGYAEGKRAAASLVAFWCGGVPEGGDGGSDG